MVSGESSRLAFLALSRDVRPTRELLLAFEPRGTSSRALREVRSSNYCCSCMIFICDCRFSTEFVRLWISSACCSSRSGRKCVSSRSLPTSESSDCWVFSNLSMRARVVLTRSDRGNRELTLLSSKRMRSASAPDSAAEVTPPPSSTEPRERPRELRYGGLHRSAIGSNYPKVARRLGFALTQRDGLARILRVSIGLPQQLGDSLQYWTLERLLLGPGLNFRTPLVRTLRLPPFGELVRLSPR